MKKVNVAVMIFAAMFAGAVSAQQLKVATGGATGTYSKLFKEMVNVCSGSGLSMIEVASTGSVENVNNLVGNQINAAFTQTDVLFYRAQTEDLGNIKTLLALHPEEVHFIAPTVSSVKTGGMMGVGAKPVEFNTISDLAGYKVGAAGGSFVTAQVVRLQSEIAYQAVSYNDNAALLAALASGEIQAAVMVGGAPMEAVSNLGPNYKLLSVSDSTANKLKGVYRTARLSYLKMNANGVQTVATDALLVTREYKTEKYVTGLSKFRTCVLGQLDELKETTGTHPKWQTIKGDNKGKWAWYELPATGAPAKK